MAYPGAFLVIPIYGALWYALDKEAGIGRAPQRPCQKSSGACRRVFSSLIGWIEMARAEFCRSRFDAMLRSSLDIEWLVSVAALLFVAAIVAGRW